MAINSVQMNKALNNEAYAAQVIRSGKCSASERGQLAAKWGSDKIAQWESVDSTKYEISDEQVSTAKAKGDKKVDEATDGFDGKSDGVKSATMGTVGAVGGVAGAGMGVVTAITQLFSHGKFISNPFVSAVIGAVLLANSIMLKALAPNKEQAQACDDLQSTMQDSQSELEDQQGILSDTTNEIVDSTDELSKASEETNKQTETKQKEYERLQQEYQALQEKYQASKTGGEPLTEAEKARYEQLSGVLGTKFEELQQVKVDGDAAVEEAQEAVEEQQEVYDDTAMKIEEVQEITDFQSEFDEATVDNAKFVKTSAKIGIVGAAGVVASGIQGVLTAGLNFAQYAAGGVAIATGGASGIILSGVVKDQGDYQSRAEAGVDTRHATEDVNTATSELYDEELDNYAGSIDLIDEIEITESTATETPVVALGEDPAPAEGGNNPTSQSSVGDSSANANPFAPPSGNDGADETNPFANPDKKPEEE